MLQLQFLCVKIEFHNYVPLAAANSGNLPYPNFISLISNSLGRDLNQENKVDYRFCTNASIYQIYYFNGVSFCYFREK